MRGIEQVVVEQAEHRVAGRLLTMAAGSVVGQRYPQNYDVVHLDRERPLAVVADGMGDGRGSAAAGRTAVEVFVAGAAASAPGLRSAVAEVQSRVRAAGARLPGLTGCTLTAFLAAPEGDAWLVQLGDSRVYRLRAGLLELLTTDHTVAWLGAIHGWWAHDSAEARSARYRLTRYAGHPDSPEPDVLSVTLRPGDLYLLCTDGVADQVSYARLTEVLRGTYDPGRAVTVLLTDSLAAGGDDNATAVVIRVGDGGGGA